jgi:uncharacterized protein YgiM (DUF1202 family)
MSKKLLIIGLLFFTISPFLFSESYLFEKGTYYLLDGRVNVRSEPSLNSRVLGQLNVNTEVKVIECAFNEQIIEGVSAYWYKIEYNNDYGYIWGGYIAVQTLIYDIDNNGVNDYFHYRVSEINKNYTRDWNKKIIDWNKDIFIYINHKLIKNNFFYVEEYRKMNFSNRWFNCHITINPKNSEEVRFTFEGGEKEIVYEGGRLSLVYSVDKMGRFRFVEAYH